MMPLNPEAKRLYDKERYRRNNPKTEEEKVAESAKKKRIRDEKKKLHKQARRIAAKALFETTGKYICDPSTMTPLKTPSKSQIGKNFQRLTSEDKANFLASVEKKIENECNTDVKVERERTKQRSRNTGLYESLLSGGAEDTSDEESVWYNAKDNEVSDDEDKDELSDDEDELSDDEEEVSEDEVEVVKAPKVARAKAASKVAPAKAAPKVARAKAPVKHVPPAKKPVEDKEMSRIAKLNKRAALVELSSYSDEWIDSTPTEYLIALGKKVGFGGYNLHEKNIKKACKFHNSKNHS